MTRPLRIQFPGAWYHVMNRGAGRQKIFITNSHREKFLELIEEVSSIYDIETHAYCLMGNHYHLLLHTPMGNLSEGMRFLNSNYTMYYNRETKRDGALFRGRYKSILVNGDNYLLRLSRYIHQNPIKAELVSSLVHYKWSSYQAYLKLVEPKEWLQVRTITEKFNDVCNDGISYQDYVEKYSDPEIVDLFDKSKLTPILADETFRKYISDKIQQKAISPEIFDVKLIYNLPTIDVIIKVTANYFGLTSDEVSKNIINNIPRAVAMILCRESGLYKLTDLIQKFNAVSYKSISSTIRRAKKDKNIKQHVNDIKNLMIKKKIGGEWEI